MNEPGSRAIDPNASVAVPADTDHRFFGHPLGLSTLAGVEMWERFSFYGMQALLAYYIYFAATDGGLGYSEAVATSIVGAYGGAVYLSAILAGWVADRVLGAERTLFVAAVMIMVGHLSLSLVPGLAGVGIGCVLIALGSGALKTTTSTVVGTMYRRADPRRDAAFSIYYMGVNIGALVGPLLTGLLQSRHGFHWGFGLAAAGMAAGLIQYVIMRPRTLARVSEGAPNPLGPGQARRTLTIAAAVLAGFAILCAVHVVTLGRLAGIVTVLTVLAAVAVFAFVIRHEQLSADERSRVIAYIPLFIASASFWALFQQQSSVLAIYADKRLDRDVFGWDMPNSWVQSINPLFIIVFAGIFSALWLRWGSRQPSSAAKFATSNVIMGLAFLAFLPFTHDALTPLLAIVGILFLFTMAELLISPVGQSFATRIAPQAFRSQTVALHFLSVAIGSAAAGTLAGYYRPDDHGAERTYFLLVGLASVAVGVVMFALRPWVWTRLRGLK